MVSPQIAPIETMASAHGSPTAANAELTGASLSQRKHCSEPSAATPPEPSSVDAQPPSHTSGSMGNRTMPVSTPLTAQYSSVVMKRQRMVARGRSRSGLTASCDRVVTLTQAPRQPFSTHRIKDSTRLAGDG